MKTRVLVTLTLCLSSQIAFAKIDRSKTKPLVMPPQEQKEKITVKDVEKVIPLDLQPTDNMNFVANRVADRGLQTWFNSSAVKNSSLGRTASNVQETMKTEVTVKPTKPEGVQHKFSMQVLALQTAAKVQYSGWMNAVFNYDAKAAQSMVEFSEKVFNKDLFLNHKTSSHETVSSVGIKWGW